MSSIAEKFFAKKKNQTVVCFPKHLETEHYLGDFYGYYVENTNYYNIVTEKAESNYPTIKKIGKITGKRPKTQPKELTGFFEEGKLVFMDTDGKIAKNEPFLLKLDIFSRNVGILESDVMLKTGAVLVGCGSVGSLVALELAKAGVGRFLLVDNDILGYHNICRHQCGLLDVGTFKTDAVKDRILQINPTAKVVTQNCTIQEVPLNLINEFCDKDTIVIGGADNREGDLYANGIAKEIGMPMMSIGCWERAFAGEIFYCLPEGMPDYSDFIWAIGGMSGRVNQNRKFYTTEEELEKAAFEPGISVDIDFVTVIAIKLALDILNRNNPNFTPRLLGHLTQYTLVCNTNNPKIGGDNAEIFSYPLQVTTSIEVPYAPKEGEEEKPAEEKAEKKPAAKKAAKKPAAKKESEKKPAAKKAVKKPAPKKESEKKPAAKKSSGKKS